MGLHYSPKIITDGLVEYFSVPDPNSYSGSGGTWYSLINGNTGPGNPSWANNISEITIQLWLEKTGTATGYANHPVSKWNDCYCHNASFILYHFENYQGNGNDGQLAWLGNSTAEQNSGWTGIAGSGTSMVSGEFANIVLQYNSRTGGQMWKNGQKIGGKGGTTGVLGQTSIDPTTYDIGIYGPTAAGTSRVHEIMFYKRELSDAEIQHNFNMRKGKYGF